jgi:hypothetical protein
VNPEVPNPNSTQLTSSPSGRAPPYPASTPPPSEGVFPFSFLPADAVTSLVAPALLPTIPTGTGPLQAIVPCTLAPDFPAQFGGTRTPLIDADPPYSTLP